MKRKLLSRPFMVAFNLLVVMAMLVSLGGWQARHVSASVLNPPVIAERPSVNVDMSVDSNPVPFNLTLHATGTGTLTWSVSSPASHGTASASGTGASMAVGYTPAGGYEGSDSFTVKVDDGNGGADTIIVYVWMHSGLYPDLYVGLDNPNQVSANKWPAGTELTLTIDDPSNGPSIDYTDTATVADSGDIFNNQLQFNLGTFTLQYGFIVTVSGGGITRSMPVGHSPAIETIDEAADTISGTADAGWKVYVFTNTAPTASRHYYADAQGNWHVDFSKVGDESNEQTFLDLKAGVSGWMNAGYFNGSDDYQGNTCCTRWEVPSPRLEVNIHTSNDFVHARDWPVGTQVTLTIKDAPDAVPFYNTTVPVMADLWGTPGADFEMQGNYHIEGGDLMEASGGGITVDYTIPNLKVTSFDTATDHMSGIGKPGANLWDCFNIPMNCISRNPVPDSFGNWTVDFTAAGDPGNPDNVADLQTGSHGWVTEFDGPDSNTANQTQYSWDIQDSLFRAYLGGNTISGANWTPGDKVSLSINDPTNGPGIDFSGVQYAQWDNTVSFTDLSGLNLSAGMSVTLAGDYTTKSLIVGNLAVTQVDASLDTVSGTGTPGDAVTVQSCDSGCPWVRHMVVAGSGDWQVDFSVAGAGTDEQQTLDITAHTIGDAMLVDSDGDATSVPWSGPIIRPYYTKASAAADWVHAYGWQNNDVLTLTIDNHPGHTYHATASPAQWDPGSAAADVVGTFDLTGADAYDLQAGDVLTISGAGHTETYTVPASMTSVRWFIGTGAGNDRNGILVEQQVVDDYNAAHPDLELVTEIEPTATAPATLAAQISSGNGPDIVGPMGFKTSNEFHNWLDLEPLIHSSGFDTGIFSAAEMEQFHTEEGQVALPFSTYPSAIYYIPALFDAAGLHYPPATYGAQYQMPNGTWVDWNWDTVTQVAKLLTLDATNKNSTQAGFDANSITQFGFSFGWEGPPAYWGTFWQSGRILQGQPGAYSAQIPAGWKAAWQWVYTGMMGSQPYIPNGAYTGSQNFENGNVFDSGRVAMLANPSWYTCCVGNLVGSGKTFQFGAMPSYNGVVGGRMDSDSFRIWKDSPHPQEAFDALAYLVTTGADKLVVGTPGQNPAYGGVPAEASKQGAWRAAQAASFPFVSAASWDVLLAGRDHPDVPNAESYMPNMTAAWNRIQQLGNLISGTSGLDLAAEEATLESDLTSLFNAAHDPPIINQVLPLQGRSIRANDIYIYGENFVTGATVRLGIADLPTTVYSSSQIRATVPMGLAVGAYNLTVTNPDGGGSATRLHSYTVLPEVVDDLSGNSYELWSSPSTLHNGDSGQVGLVVHRQGGENALTNLHVRFYLGTPEDGVLLGDGSIASLAPRGAESTTGVNWTPNAAGAYTITAVIDPANAIPETVETNNVVSRTVTVVARTVDQTPPQVSSFVVNDGNASITNLTVSLDTTATDAGGSGLASIEYVQYQYSDSADIWAPVQDTGWLDYETNKTDHAWTLLPSAGVIYLQAWVMDHAGNISVSPADAYVNYLPPSDSVAYEQAHVYRYLLSAGQSMTVHVTPLSGDPDLYIWAPDYATMPRDPWVSNIYNGVEELTINAPIGGLYQVEVYGYSAASYTVEVLLGAAGAKDLVKASRQDAVTDKTVYTEPYVSLESAPDDHYALPPVNTTPPIYYIYLPMVVR